MRPIVFCVAMAVVATTSADARQLYRWVDPSGRVFYTDKLPPKEAHSIEQKKLGDRPPELPLPYELQRAVKAFPVVLYSSDCGPPCDAARQLLDKRGVPHDERDARDPVIQQEMARYTGGPVEVPLMLVGRSPVKGFEPAAWNNALDAAGYPKTSIIPPAVAAERAKQKAAAAAAKAEAGKPGTPKPEAGKADGGKSDAGAAEAAPAPTASPGESAPAPVANPAVDTTR